MTYDIKQDTKNLNRDHLRGLGTTAAKIRYLHSLGYDRKEISNILFVRYQHVRNELTRIVKRPTQDVIVSTSLSEPAGNALLDTDADTSVTEPVMWS